LLANRFRNVFSVASTPTRRVLNSNLFSHKVSVPVSKTYAAKSDKYDEQLQQTHFSNILQKLDIARSSIHAAPIFNLRFLLLLQKVKNHLI
jgi:hypothetical protein